MVRGIIPETLKEALTLKNEGTYRLVAGGTDMLIQHHNLNTLPIDFKDDVIYIANLEELQGIVEKDETVEIGSCEPLESIMEHPAVPKLLKETILEMASPAIRHTGTLGGNIGNASPAGDSLVPLYLMNAIIELQSVDGMRHVDIKHLITGVRRLDLKDNEIITKIIVDKLDFTKAYFKKVGPRLSDAISKLSFAAAMRLEKDMVVDFRFAFGAVNTTVVRRPEIECQYIGLTIEEIKEREDEIVLAYEPYIKPIDDQRSTKEYRKQISLNLLRDFIRQL